MKKLTTFAFMMFVCHLVMAQEVQHHAYTTYYNAAKLEADSVSWDLTPDMVGCTDMGPRKDKFAPDPQITNCPTKAAYTNSGYDRGHLFPYADAECNSTDQVECFYMSNMLPQLHALNAGDWKTLETQERVWAHTQSIHIIAGGYGSKGQLTSGVSIPESCWKAVYVDGKWHGYVMPNENSSTGHSYSYWEVLDIKRFDEITGLHL